MLRLNNYLLNNIIFALDLAFKPASRVYIYIPFQLELAQNGLIAAFIKNIDI